MSSTSRDMVLSFVNSLVPTVRRALCDESPEVRAAAAKTFDSLHNTVGSRALGNLNKSVIHFDGKFIFYFSFSELVKNLYESRDESNIFVLVKIDPVVFDFINFFLTCTFQIT